MTALECEGCFMPINTNVAAMLRRLRFQDKERRLWLDAISINQKDNEEKKLQVQRMSEIYSESNRTIIWLGEEDDSTKDAMDMLNDLEVVVDKAWTASKGKWPLLEVLQSCGLPDRRDPRWLCFQTLLHNRWFTRTWILQEVSLSVNAWIHRGPHVFEWKKLLRIVLCLCRALVHGLYELELRYVYTLSYFCSSRAWWHDASLISLLHTTSAFSSTLKKDRVFALVGLSAEREALQHLISYREEGEEDITEVMNVYKEVAWYFLKKGNLTVLNLASDPGLRDLHGMPTWVPDWSSWTRAEPLIGHLYLGEGLYISPENAHSTIAPSESDDPYVIVVPGTIVDRVTQIGNHLPFLREVTPCAEALYFVAQWRHLAGNDKKYRTGEVMDEAFARTVTMNVPSEVLDQYKYDDVYKRYMALFPRRKRTRTIKEDGRFSETHEFRNRMLNVCQKRTFFTTEKGYMGIGPYFLRTGDAIVNFDGGVTPFVIRRAGKGRYSFVGDAYVHGMMDLRSSDLDFEYISLV